MNKVTNIAPTFPRNLTSTHRLSLLNHTFPNTEPQKKYDKVHTIQSQNRMFGKTQRTDFCNELKHRVTFFSDFNLVSHFNVKHSAIRAHSRTQNTSLCVDAHDSYCATFYVMIHWNGWNYLGAWIMWIILNKAKKKRNYEKFMKLILKMGYIMG